MQTSDRSAETHDGDQALASLLDCYLSALHSGDSKTCHDLLTRHAELRELAVCLDDLESLAPAEPHPSSVAPQPNDPQVAESSAIRQFGKYELLEELGRGGMGVVYRARQTDLDRIVALKMILASRLASADDVRRFYSEAKAAGRLHHSNIVGIHEVSQCDGQHYFAMDCVDGDSLTGLIRRQCLTPDGTATCLVKIARAVHYLHSHDIVHRDLKPSNILIGESNEPYVTDFGLAKVFLPDSQQTATGTIVGTPAYMAPEQAAGHGTTVAPTADIYSLGAILYEMLTGRPPFQADSPLDTLVQVLENEPQPPTRVNPSVPRELELICLKCLEKDPAKRYPSAGDLADDLDRYLKREPVEARPSGLVQRTRRWARREPALVSRLAVLAVIATIVQMNYMLRGVDLAFHIKVMSIFAIWPIVAFVCQALLNHERFSNVSRYLWCAADVLLLTGILLLSLTDGPIGPLLIGYPVLIAAAGLFFRVRLVFFTTVVCLLSYALLTVLGHGRNHPTHYPIIFAGALATLGFIVGYQVYRVRVLSRYYENRSRV